MWRQKSRELWLKLWDKNSKFFHLSTIIRRKRNSIDAMRDENGSWITEGNSIKNTFLNYFKNLFQQSESDFPPHFEQLVLPCITEDENVELCRIPSHDEIRSTLFQTVFLPYSISNSGQPSATASSMLSHPSSSEGPCLGR